jgi:hypothetical protein
VMVLPPHSYIEMCYHGKEGAQDRDPVRSDQEIVTVHVVVHITLVTIIIIKTVVVVHVPCRIDLSGQGQLTDGDGISSADNEAFYVNEDGG